MAPHACPLAGVAGRARGGRGAALAMPHGARGAGGDRHLSSTFQVLHDDRMGRLKLPEGPYTITVRGGLSCASASDLFRQFLEDWDGKLPRPWVTNVSTATFTRGSNGAIGFSVKRASNHGGGGGGGHHPANGASCPSFFRVLHNDRIGNLKVAAGNYRITILAVGRISCASASRLFAQFLQDFDGRLPRPWILDVQTGSFLRGSAHVGFRVKRASGKPVNPNGGGTHPAERHALQGDLPGAAQRPNRLPEAAARSVPGHAPARPGTSCAGASQLSHGSSRTLSAACHDRGCSRRRARPLRRVAARRRASA